MFQRNAAKRPGRVLIVDGSNESRQVLSAVLGCHGLDTLETGEARQGLDMAREQRPDLILLDIEETDVDEATCEQLASCEQTATYGQTTVQPGQENIPLVLLGSTKTTRPEFPTRQRISKPYHYGPLIRRIEELIRQSHDGAHDRAA